MVAWRPTPHYNLVVSNAQGPELVAALDLEGIEALAKATSFFLLIVFALVNLSLWRLKGRIAGERHGNFSVPRRVPATGFVATMVFLMLQTALELAG